jgi:hypothetical protein
MWALVETPLGACMAGEDAGDWASVAVASKSGQSWGQRCLDAVVCGPIGNAGATMAVANGAW